MLTISEELKKASNLASKHVFEEGMSPKMAELDEYFKDSFDQYLPVESEQFSEAIDFYNKRFTIGDVYDFACEAGYDWLWQEIEYATETVEKWMNSDPFGFMFTCSKYPSIMLYHFDLWTLGFELPD